MHDGAARKQSKRHGRYVHHDAHHAARPIPWGGTDLHGFYVTSCSGRKTTLKAYRPHWALAGWAVWLAKGCFLSDTTIEMLLLLLLLVQRAATISSVSHGCRVEPIPPNHLSLRALLWICQKE